jgi:hypothetical protein
MTITLPRALSFGAAAATLSIIALSSPLARADLLPSCDDVEGSIQCAATDVGKPCQGGGQCHEVLCATVGLGMGARSLYRCRSCPTVLTSSTACSLSNLDAACGDGDGGQGRCGVIPADCEPGAKVACVIQGAVPTGPPAGSGSSGGGCDIAPKPPKPTMIGLGLLAFGAVAFLFDCARRRPRESVRSSARKGR